MSQSNFSIRAAAIVKQQCQALGKAATTTRVNQWRAAQGKRPVAERTVVRYSNDYTDFTGKIPAWFVAYARSVIV